MTRSSDAEDANTMRQAAQEAAEKARDVVAGMKETAGYAADTGRAYARDAMNAASKNLDATKARASQAADYLTLSVNADPIKAVVITAALSALVTGLVLMVLNSDRR